LNEHFEEGILQRKD